MHRIIVAVLAAAGVFAVASSQSTLYVVQPYLGRLMDNSNYRSLNSTSWFYRWPGTAPFPSAVWVAPDRTRVHNGQCATFVQMVSNRAVPTGSWVRGVPLVVNGRIRTDLVAGTVVATMDGPGGKYPSANQHVAVFLRRIDDTRIEVADQNAVGALIVGKHRWIRIGASGSLNAARYWTVRG